jgi:hypothetical protein
MACAGRRPASAAGAAGVRIDAPRKGLHQVDEAVALGDHALVVRGDPHRRRHLLHLLPGAAELAQVGRGVAVVGAEAGQVDVADEGHALRLDQQHAVAGGVAGQVLSPARWCTPPRSHWAPSS